MHELHGDQAEPLLLEALDDLPHQPPLDAVGLDGDEGALAVGSHGAAGHEYTPLTPPFTPPHTRIHTAPRAEGRLKVGRQPAAPRPWRRPARPARAHVAPGPFPSLIPFPSAATGAEARRLPPTPL